MRTVVLLLTCPEFSDVLHLSQPDGYRYTNLQDCEDQVSLLRVDLDRRSDEVATAMKDASELSTCLREERCRIAALLEYSMGKGAGLGHRSGRVVVQLYRCDEATPVPVILILAQMILANGVVLKSMTNRAISAGDTHDPMIDAHPYLLFTGPHILLVCANIR